MTVIKLSKSGKALLVIDDFGNVFVCPKVFVDNLSKKGGFVLMSRFPTKVSLDRFKVSPLYDPDNVGDSKDVKLVNDGLSKSFIKDKEEKKFYGDDVVW